jgi:hypothetical protein
VESVLAGAVLELNDGSFHYVFEIKAGPPRMFLGKDQLSTQRRQTLSPEQADAKQWLVSGLSKVLSPEAKLYVESQEV